MKFLPNDYFDPGGRLASHLNKYEFRPQQVEMSAAVFDAISKEAKLVVEAGTGTGKTLSYLVPAILSGHKVIVSTGSKNLQEQLKLKDLPLLKKALPVDFTAITMKGRSNYLCIRRYIDYREQHQASFFEKSNVQDIFSWGDSTETGERTEYSGTIPREMWQEVDSRSELCLGRKCNFYHDCFVTKLRIKAQKADILFVNHHLFFSDVRLRSNSDNSLLPKAHTVIFDEAHMLESIATSYFGYLFNRKSVLELMNELKRELKTIPEAEVRMLEPFAHLANATNAFFEAFLAMGKEGTQRLYKKDFNVNIRDAADKIKSIMDSIGEDLYLTTDSDPIKRLMERFDDRKNALETILNYNENKFVCWMEGKDNHVTLHASPIDISENIQKEVFPLAKSFIFTSATITSGQNDFSFFQRQIGLTEKDMFLQLDTHFDFKNSVLYYFPKDVPDPNSEGFVDYISGAIHDLIMASKGRTLVLFTSYKSMNGVHKNIKGKIPYTIYRQQDGMDSNTIINKFMHEKHSVLFGTSSFWQGVDIVGESLSCLIIDKLPFASPGDPILAARIDHINAKGGNPFMDYQVPMAAITLKQGFGRLIRNKDDRGVFSLLDNRVFTKRYGKKFIRALPETRQADTVSEVEEFFSL